VFVALLSPLTAQAQRRNTVSRPSLTFTVSMPQPGNHLYHVTFRCAGLEGDLQDFKMPQWSPGFYGIGNYARYVSSFRADDGASHALGWEKVARNTWRVVSDGAPVVVLNYDVFAAVTFPANSYLGDDRAYISPSGMFLYPVDHLRSPVTLNLELPAFWKQISTGLEPVQGKPATLQAADYDVLYDSPILIGNQESLTFEVKGVPHNVTIENVPPEVDRTRMIADLKTMVTAATALMNDIPYRSYTFLMMGRGGGGIEHSNSSSNQFDGKTLTTPAGYLRWLSFICHEYFHNFNVKRIRPLALGPFDYDQENLTSMLWVSEGLSVYYQDLILVRAGLMTRDQYLTKLAAAIGTFENLPGRRYQSAAESSQNTWNVGSGFGGGRKTTGSTVQASNPNLYYNNGGMLGAMLDLSIRSGSGNQLSLDDVMRSLYRKYYLGKKRGFTDAEFRAECETAAGTSLAEIFEYASTTKEVDYAKYFALGGLALDFTTTETAGGFIGLDTFAEEIPASAQPVASGGGRGRNSGPEFKLLVSDTVSGSPAAAAGLKPGDRIIAIDGIPATVAALNDAINAKLGGRIVLHVSTGGAERDVALDVAKKLNRTYQLTPKAAAQAQERILNHWLRKAL